LLSAIVLPPAFSTATAGITVQDVCPQSLAATSADVGPLTVSAQDAAGSSVDHPRQVASLPELHRLLPSLGTSVAHVSVSGSVEGPASVSVREMSAACPTVVKGPAAGDICVVIVNETTFSSGRVSRTLSSFGLTLAENALEHAFFFVNTRASASGRSAPDDLRMLVSNQLGVRGEHVFVGDVRAALASVLTGTTVDHQSVEAVDLLRSAIRRRLQASATPREAKPGPSHRIEVDGRFAKSSDTDVKPDRYVPRSMTQRLPASTEARPARLAQPASASHETPQRYSPKVAGSAAVAAHLVMQQNRFTPKSVAV
jgi:hypothetical protein